MDKFCIITNVEKDEKFQITHMIMDYLTAHKKKYVVAVNENIDLYRKEGFILPSEIPDDMDCAIVLGGDGTMILAASDLVSNDIPIVGVNLGTLGFLTEIEQNMIHESLDALFDGNYKIESRLMLEGSIFCNEKEVYSGYALNDFVINKKGTSGLIRVKIYVNDEVANTYLCDGIIISTPTGSTGYNLSAGGPIVAPYSKVMIITPICPHALFNRSIIVSQEDKIRIELGKRSKNPDEAIISLDGRLRMELQTGDAVEITKGKKKTKLIKVNNNGFFDLLRTKLGEDKE
ncbi:NAD+ kinase [Mobilisporobacter senegalensis]|uniref:NAD kinase n=1 Tax=Mobilisporobacter senegalensis TaxID=1329262 RepID=A0A3N1XPU2_9FIRM|nr:NAD(+)/NADH kinase [Mobilisporobacter senegalensis]ROR27122.1 NAD+ kinase [Mobilisporobacter senegalensis]